MKLLLALSLLAAMAAGDDLPAGKGKELIETTCTKCHSSKQLSQQRLSRAAWDRAITVMQQRNGLWDLEPDVRKEILDYLESHFAPQAKDSMDGLGPRTVNPLPN